jgi:hypothetical protein
MGEVGKEPKPLRIIFCGREFPGAEIYTRESLKKYPHLQVSSLFSGFGRGILGCLTWGGLCLPMCFAVFRFWGNWHGMVGFGLGGRQKSKLVNSGYPYHW